MRCRSCGMASIHDALGIHAWHCLNCGHVNEAVSRTTAGAEDADLSVLEREALLRHEVSMVWW
jgi:hypothetical protein